MMHILDVGANIGAFGLELARRNQNINVHLIEPVPSLAEELRLSKLHSQLLNVEVHQIALNTQDAEVIMQVSMLGDRGTTSLLPFDTKKINSNPYWRTRTDFSHQSAISVAGMRLDTFLSKNDIESVDFIKIDVQGIDLEILSTAGLYLPKIEAGMLEVPTTEGNALYDGEKQTLQSALNFLSSNGFAIVAIKPNDPACNEVNVFFSRNPNNWFEHVGLIGLPGIDAFDGKHYWHACSSSPSYADDLNEGLAKENTRLLNRIVEQDARIQLQETRIGEQDARIGAQDARINELSTQINMLEIAQNVRVEVKAEAHERRSIND